MPRDWETEISWMPRTSPTFQSVFGLSGWLLWQATHTSPIRTGVAIRTCRSSSEPETSTTDWLGSLRSAVSACCSKSSSGCRSRPLNGKSETNRYLTAPSWALMRLPSSIDRVAGIGMAPGTL